MRRLGTTAIFTRAAWSCELTCSIPAMDGQRFPVDWCVLPEPKVRSSPCSAGDTARMRGCCGTAPWIPSACCTRAISRSHCAADPPDVPSSVADRVFWLGRYVERAENTARIVRSMVTRVRRAEPAELGCLVRLHGCSEVAAQ